MRFVERFRQIKAQTRRQLIGVSASNRFGYVIGMTLRAQAASRPLTKVLAKDDIRGLMAELGRREAPFLAALTERPLPDFPSVREAFKHHCTLLHLPVRHPGEDGGMDVFPMRRRAYIALEKALRGHPDQALKRLDRLVAWRRLNPGEPDGVFTPEGFVRAMWTPITPATLHAAAGAIGYLIDDATAAHYYGLSHAENAEDDRVALMLAVLLVRNGRGGEAITVIDASLPRRRSRMAAAEEELRLHPHPSTWEVFADERAGVEALEHLRADAAGSSA